MSGEVAAVAEPAARAVAVVDKSEAQSYIAVLASMANSPTFNVDAFTSLVALKDAAQAAEAKREFNRAMSAVQSVLPQVVRNAENSQTKSAYATLEAIGEAIDPIITGNGFSQSFGSAEGAATGYFRVTCRTAHVAGHEQEDMLDVPIDIAGIAGTKNKTPTHAMASTITYGRRILKMMIFDVKSRVAMPDDDGNAAGGAPACISDEQVAEIEALIVTSNLARVKVLKAFKVDKIEDLPSDRFDDAKAKLIAKINADKQKVAA